MTSYAHNIEVYEQRLRELLAATPIKYSAWPPSDTTSLSASAGIYHFFEVKDDVIASLYVGKAGFGGGGEWSLYERLKQHFQPSQPNTLLGKAAKALNRNPDEIKATFVSAEVYLQWLPLLANATIDSTNLSAELVWFECFCKAILKPRYTNA